MSRRYSAVAAARKRVDFVDKEDHVRLLPGIYDDRLLPLRELAAHPADRKQRTLFYPSSL